MKWYFWVLIAVGILLLMAVGLAYYCYRRIFYSPKRKPHGEHEFPLPDGDEYLPYRKTMVDWMKKMRTMPHEDFSVQSHDGLTLRGKYFEYKKGAPVELMFHGYRGDGERDLSGGIERCFALERNAVIVDQRGSGASDGDTITFGVLERWDCLRWVDFLIERFGEDVEIILTGISMGGATVLMAAGEPLPKNVKSVLADCGFSSAREMIKKEITRMKLPAKLIYPFVRLGGKWFGHFDIDETTAMHALARCKLPIIFLHGDHDFYVPFSMSERMYARYEGKKSLVLIEGAGHGLAYPANKDKYLRAVKAFEKEWKNT